MKNLKVYILEDEIITQELLKETLKSFDLTICGAARNAEVALKEIELFKPDIAILDIRVEGNRTGIWLGNQLKIPFIYLTAFNDIETIKKAIVTEPISYLIKPFNTKDLFIAVELAVNKVKNDKQITIKDKDKNLIIFEDEILFAKKQDHYLALYLKEGKKIIRSSIQDFLDQIETSSFIQVHRSYLINTNHISAFNTKEIMIKNHKIPLSKTFSEKFLKKIT